jgi:hypothetical protein
MTYIVKTFRRNVSTTVTIFLLMLGDVLFALASVYLQQKDKAVVETNPYLLKPESQFALAVGLYS